MLLQALLILLGIGLVLAPLRWLMPSPRDKQLAGLREQARRSGLMVSLLELPQNHRANVRGEDAERGARYLLPRHKRKSKAVDEGLWLKEEWQQVPPPGFTKEQMERWFSALPASCVAIQNSPEGVAVWWRETGVSADVETIAAVLSEMEELIA